MNLKEMARQLGLSVSTISRILGGKARDFRISAETEQKVLEFSRRHNFKPNQVARGLRLQHTNTIGLVIPDISNEFFAHIARAIEVEARQKHYSIILCDSQDQTVQEAELIQLLLERRVDGIILAPVGLQPDHLVKLTEEKFPLVVIDRYFAGTPIPHVTSANYQGALEATRYLFKKGHRQIACIQGLTESSPNQERVKGYLDAMSAAGLNDLVKVVGTGFSAGEGYQAVKDLLDHDQFPTAIFSLSNVITLGAIQALRDSKLTIPEQVSLVSFDDHAYATLLDPPLTVIEQEKQVMGRLAVSILEKLIKSEVTDEAQVVLPCRLIERGSVKQI